MVSANTYSQTKYESPYVFDGQSFEVTLPSGFKLFNFETENNPTFFSQNPSFNPELFDKDPENCLFIFHIPNVYDGRDLIEIVKEDMITENENDILRAPSLLMVGETEVAQLQMIMREEGMIPATMNISFLQFHDCMVMIALVSVDDAYLKNNINSYNTLVNSLKIVQTDRENMFDEIYDDYDDDYDEAVYYQNSKFETVINYEDVFFDYATDNNDWLEDLEIEYPELLNCFNKYDTVTYESEGSVKIFSGGLMGYDMNLMLKALQTVFPDQGISTLNLNYKKVLGEFTFNRYSVNTVSKQELIPPSLYTTMYKDEMVFILFTPTETTTNSFLNSYDDFVSSFWIWDEELDGSEE